jgi:hypothetical protein
MMDNLLQQGIAAYKAGKRNEARNMFIANVKQNPESELAWGWMYQTSDTGKERLYCLKQMLRINPNNEKTGQLLNQIIASPPAPTLPDPPTSPAPGTPVAPDPKPENPPKVATSKCPRCQEEIQTGAERCKYCGWDRNEKKLIQKQKKTRKRSSIISIVVIIFVIMVCGLLYGLFGVAGVKISPTAIPTKTTEENAWYACTLFVEKQLKVSIIDAQKFNSNGVVLLDNGQYRVDINYAKLLTTYTCVVLDRTGGSWELISLVATRK